MREPAKVYLKVALVGDRLVMELPGAAGGVRHVEVFELETISRTLHGMESEARAIGLAGAPTEMQALHEAKHGLWPNDKCAFCRAEMRAKGTGIAGPAQNRFRPLADGVEIRRIPGKPTAKSKRSLEELGLD